MSDPFPELLLKPGERGGMYLSVQAAVTKSHRMCGL